MLQNLINLLFPKTCPGCTASLETHEHILCTSCRHELPLTRQHLVKENDSYGKFYGRLPLEHISALLLFHKEGIVQQLIHHLKYKGHQEIGTLLGDWYAPDVRDSLTTVDAIIPVPLHPKRLRERGYNQVTTFARALSRNLEIPIADHLLFRTSYAKTQTQKNLFSRTEVRESPFVAKFDTTDHNKHYLIVDDVLTSGATMEACGKALLEIPGTKLSIVTMAVAHS